MNNRIEIAQDFANKINSKYIKQIILYGSVARHEDTKYSDIDILIISNHRDKIWPVLRNQITNIGLNQDELISAHVISEEMFNKTKNYSFLTNVMKEGLIIGWSWGFYE